MINFENREARKEFIQNNESSIYEGKNVDNERVIVVLEQGKGMDIKTQKHTKPNWLEVIEYDGNGFQIGVTYESGS